MEIAPVELVGERVKLISMHESHVELLYEAGTDPQIWTYMPNWLDVARPPCLAHASQHRIQVFASATLF